MLQIWSCWRTFGPKLWADPPVIDVKAVYSPNHFAMKQSVVQCILVLPNWINDCPEDCFSPASVRARVVETSRSITSIKTGTELGEFRLMLILQLCALSLVVLLHSSPKLLKLLYQIPGKGSMNHLINVNADLTNHQDAMKWLLHTFDLYEFGTNAGDNILCEMLPGRNVFNVFFPGQSLFLLNPNGKSMMKKYASLTWQLVEDSWIP